MLEGWAIVDNTTTEDWKGVLVGVGASSALAFRYDLWSVRQIDRDLLAGEEKFAIAPPTGVSPYAGATAEELVALDATEVRSGATAQRSDLSGKSASENSCVVDGVNTTGLTYGTIDNGVRGVVSDARSGDKLAGVTVIATSNHAKQTQTAITDEQGSYAIALTPGTYTMTFFYGESQIERTGVTVGAAKVTPVSARARAVRFGCSRSISRRRQTRRRRPRPAISGATRRSERATSGRTVR